MSYRELGLARIEAARARMDDALRSSTDAIRLRETWQAILRELTAEQPPECDRVWMNDRLFDLQMHVYGSPRWRGVFGDTDEAMPDLLDGAHE